MRTFTTDAETDDGTRIEVEYHYEDNTAMIERAWRRADEAAVELTDAEAERIEAWINEHRFFDDHAE